MSPCPRNPSLSFDDNKWAWHEAEMNRVVDDMVAFSSSYSTNGNEGLGKVSHSSSASADILSEKKVSGFLANLPVNVEGKSGDPLLYSLLPPIIIPNISCSLRW